MKTNRYNRFLSVALIAAALPSMALALDINEDVNVDGTVTIAPSTAPVDTFNFAPSLEGSTLPTTGQSPNSNTTVVATVLGTTTEQTIQTTAGGVAAETNGNVTLAPQVDNTSTLSYLKAVSFEVWNPGSDQEFLADGVTPNPAYDAAANPGFPKPGSERQVAGYIDGEGNFVEVGPIITTVGDPREGLIDLAAADPALLPNLPTTSQDVTSGGDLLVGGDADVDGTLSVGDVADVEGALDALGTQDEVLQANIDAEAATREAADETLQANIDAEAATREAADETLQNNIDAEAATREAADETLQNNIDAEEAARIAADTTLQNNIDAEAATRLAEDTSIRTEFRAADVTLQNNINAEVSARIADVNAEEAARIAADTAITTEFRAADTAIKNEFRAADAAINQRIDEGEARLTSAESAIKSNRYQIDRNTRGIAMVAAMTNTTIQPGMKQAIDFNMAQFDDATGFGFGYGYRVNENLQINAAGASTTDFEEGVARLGVSYQW